MTVINLLFIQNNIKNVMHTEQYALRRLFSVHQIFYVISSWTKK